MKTIPGLGFAALATALLLAPPALAQTARVDPTFSTAGLVVLPWGTSNLEREVVTATPDGGVFILHEGPQDITVMRLGPDGLPVAAYVGGGVARFQLAEPFNLSAVHVEADGGLMLGGGRDLIRVLASGRVDESFGEKGRTRVPFVTDGVCATGSARAIFRAADGGWLVVAGRTYFDTAERGCTYVARVRADGRPDLAFGVQGNLVRSGLIPFDAAMRDGYVEIIGRYAGQHGSWVERVHPEGRMLDAFASRGSHRLGDNGPPFFGADGRILADGSLVFVAATDQPTLVLRRYRADHQFDTRFAGVGRTVVGVRDGVLRAPRVLPLPDGGFIVRGAAVPPGPTLRMFGVFYKVDARGLPDPTFGGEGYAIHVAASLSQILAWAVLPDGYVVYTAASFPSLPPLPPVIPAPPYPYFGVNAHATRIQAMPDVVEFQNLVTRHYFIAYDGLEAAGIDDGAAGPGWVRTGERFRPGGTTPVCRFYGPGPNTHFFTIEPGECEEVKGAQGWIYEGLGFFATRLANGACTPPLRAVSRLYNNRHAFNDPNHRFITDSSLVPAMVAQGWTLEGPVFCVKP